MQSVLYVVFSSMPMFVCIFWTLFFGAQYKRAHLSRRILFFFMLTASGLYFGHFVVFNHFYELIPVTDTIYSFATLSVYPIFYTYIHSLTGKISRYHLMVLLPGILLGGGIGICYACLSGDGLSQLIAFVLYENGVLPDLPMARLSCLLHWLMKYVILLEVICVLYFGFRELADFRKKVMQYFSNTLHKDMKEVINLLAALVMTSCCSILADLIGRAFFVDSFILLLVVLLPFSVLLFYIGYVGNVQRFTIDDLMEEMVLKVKSPVSGEINCLLSEEAILNRKRLKEKINLMMADKQLFLNPDLKLSDLANEMNTNRTYVYQALKQDDSISFSDYVNRFRIDFSLKLLAVEGKKIEDIAYESGFASKEVFYRNFKKWKGMTPRQYQVRCMQTSADRKP